MKTLTYVGEAGARTFGAGDGMTTARRFERGVPLEVNDEDARRILDGPHAGEFTEDPPAPGDTTQPKEGK